MYLDRKCGLSLLLSEITLLFDLSLYLNRTLAQRKVKSKVKVTQWLKLTKFNNIKTWSATDDLCSFPFGWHTSLLCNNAKAAPLVEASVDTGQHGNLVISKHHKWATSHRNIDWSRCYLGDPYSATHRTPGWPVHYRTERRQAKVMVYYGQIGRLQRECCSVHSARISSVVSLTILSFFLRSFT